MSKPRYSSLANVASSGLILLAKDTQLIKRSPHELATMTVKDLMALEEELDLLGDKATVARNAVALYRSTRQR